MDHSDEMAKPANRSFSRYAREAAELLGIQIHNARIERRLSVKELAERAGVSRGLVQRVERGDPGSSIGAAFELAAIVGVRLFDNDPSALPRHLSQARDKLSLLPKSVRPAKTEVNDDF
ncbi:helix-turn-helix transcriptional regulator [Thalassospiraceae bacterium LMO-JJ14]|nr:helix-turn-helix transcriptional regulator [Thalassospiraceae bacterium LMO-JJ14]